jgi:hypothetical protein
VAHPDKNTTEQFILCRTRARRRKEAAMLELQCHSLLAKLQQLDGSLAKHPRREAGVGSWCLSVADQLHRDRRGSNSGVRMSNSTG